MNNLGLMNGMNILIGPNGAGKTNILEALYFLRRALIDDYEEIPYLPHIEWWSPLNIMYEKNPAAAPSYEIYGSVIRKDDYELTIQYRYLAEFSSTPDRTTVAPHHHRLDLNVSSRYGEISMDIEISPGLLRITLPKETKYPWRENMAQLLLKEILEESTCSDEKCVL